MTKEAKRTKAVLSISHVMKLTNLTARQIRYYEEQHLIAPARTEGNRRLFSLRNIDELFEIQELLEEGLNIAGIKKVFELKREANKRTYKGVDLEQLNVRALVQRELKR